MESSVFPELTQLLGDAFAEAKLPCTITRTGVGPIGPSQWFCVSFEGQEDFRFFAAVSMPSEEATEVPSESLQRLNAASAAFAEIAGKSVGHAFGGAIVEERAAVPDSLELLLNVEVNGSSENFVVGFEGAALQWFETAMPPVEEEQPASMPKSMMDTLMDVELPVSILLASREASLSDVLQWGPGAIVEFEAGLGDPVDVIVNKQTVARGSVVLVDGNYGVRVTEVLAGSRAVAAR